MPLLNLCSQKQHQQMMNSRFKIQVNVNGKIRWADADKVFAHLMERYTKTIPSGEKPKPYKDKVENFFATMDIEWKNALTKAYPNVDMEIELNKSKMWLLSNSPIRNLKNYKKRSLKDAGNWKIDSPRFGKPTALWRLNTAPLKGWKFQKHIKGK